MMGNDYEIVLYAGEDVSGTSGYADHVVCVRDKERREWFGSGFDTVRTPFEWDFSAPYWQTFATRAIPALRERCDKGDLVLLTSGGNTQLPIAQCVADRAKAVEWAVGYEGICSQYCAFESYAWMHNVYGRQGIVNGRNHDWVIPNFFDPKDFLPVSKTVARSPYLLYLGRVTRRKGPHVAGDIAKQLGMKLIVAGPGATQDALGPIKGDGCTIDGDVRYVGEVGRAARAELLNGAAALLVPTLYVEPFGGVAVEAMLSGCPVVASDWGAFTETVTANRGRRFRTLGQGVEAVKQAMGLDREKVAAEAHRLYSLEAVRPRFKAWFEQINGA
jgi:glycosyltransferase involved in cell wall biosynthesis